MTPKSVAYLLPGLLAWAVWGGLPNIIFVPPLIDYLLFGTACWLLGAGSVLTLLCAMGRSRERKFTEKEG